MDRDAAKDAGQLALFDEAAPVGTAPRRRLLLAAQVVEYRFERRRRRTIGIRVSEDGLAVAAPLNAPWREIEGFLRQKERWILEKLARWDARGPRPALYGETGEILPLFGRAVTLEVAEGPEGVALRGERVEIRLPQPHRRGRVCSPL
jgi:predicted metal-dependent hydrolase